MADKDFKVVIVGGSVAGLTLANILEKFDIDYIVLEASPEIAPQLGASIGINPNGLRILDQLGCHDEVQKIAPEGMATMFSRCPEGNVVLKIDDVRGHFIQSLGYSSLFINRQMLLKVLYNNLKNKDKVLANKRVVKIVTAESKVEVVTKDGETFSGDILIGADGIHSTIRQEMWRMGKEISPGWFPADELSKVGCTYKCIFGISKPLEKMNILSVTVAGNRHFSYLIFTGPGGRIYWFLFVNLGKTLYGDEVPHFTAEDKAQLAKEHFPDIVYDGVTFRDLYANAVSSVLTPLHEHCFEKWHFQRIFTLGDAAHKFEPITGHGGNSAMESAAALVNVLLRDQNQPLKQLSDEAIHGVFAETQELRWSRAKRLIDNAHTKQRLDAMETPLWEFLYRNVIPIMPVGILIAATMEDSIDAVRIEGLPVPKRPRSVPFTDELPAKPLRKTWFPRALTATSLGLTYYLANKVMVHPNLPFDSFAGSPLKTHYTGFKTVDAALSALVWAFSHPVAGSDKTSRLQCIYLLSSLVPQVLIWTIEGHRIRNVLSLISWPSIYQATYQLIGLGKVAPLYYLASHFTSGSSRTSGRRVAPSTAKALIPALFLGYMVPTALLFAPFKDANVWQNVVAFWQPSAMYSGILTVGIAAAIRWFNRRPSDKAVNKEMEIYKKDDVEPLNSAYAFAFFTSATAHVALLAYAFYSSDVSFTNLFANLPSPSTMLAMTDATQAMFGNFKWDLVFYVASTLVHNLSSIYELRQQGYVKTKEAVKAALGLVAGQLLVGPSAAYAGVWWWRENAIARLNTM